MTNYFNCRRGASVLAVLMLTACASLRTGKVRDSLDVVSAKQAPRTLIGASGRTCTVDPMSFRNVSLGQQYRCAWDYSTSGRLIASDVTTEPRDPKPIQASPSTHTTELNDAPWWWPFGKRQKR